MDEKKLDDILASHKRWLNGEDGGKRADLREADLRGAYLRDADLSGADLRGADLHGADLHGADLRGADMYGADLRGADMYKADLRGASLRGADLCGAYLRKADLSGANLREAKNIPPLVEAVTSILPAGEIIGWKVAHGALVKLLIPADARRSNATGRKCRCDKAVVTSITDENGSPVESAKSSHDQHFIYRVGETVTPDGFDEDRWDECSHGIHFFITAAEAIDYASY